tara:strand:- start:1832 stop:2026 length:195 start_codon:yes stop_codon:yes gene_type:complete
MSINKLFILQMRVTELKEEVDVLKTKHLRTLRDLRDSIMGPTQYFHLTDGTLGTEAQLFAEIPF